jgi:hypothetical protein
VQRAILAAVGRAGHVDLPLLLLDGDALRHDLVELAERPVHLDASRGDRDVHARGQIDWLSSDSAHGNGSRVTR